jgi:hypothetical protein
MTFCPARPDGHGSSLEGMDGHPEWHVDIDLFGDDEAIFARATLHAQHVTIVGRGAARACPGVRADLRMGDTAAVGAALEDLGRQLAGRTAKPRKRSPGPELARRKDHDHHAHRS